MTTTKRGPGRPPGKKNKSKPTGKKKVEKTLPESRVREEIIAIVLFAIGVFFAIAIQTNFAGALGKIIGESFKGMFGLGAYFFPYFLIVYAILIFTKIAAPFRGKTVVLMILLFLMIDLLNAARFIPTMKYGILGVLEIYKEGIALKSGGVFGMYTGVGITKIIGIVGLYISSIVISIVCIMMLVNTPFAKFLEKGKERRHARKDRKKEALTKRKEEELAAEEQRAELEAKRETVKHAGRQVEMDYKSPSKRAAQFASFDEPKATREKVAPKPKLNSRDFKKLPDNQKKILSLMQDENLFKREEQEEGYGLDGTQPSSIKQEPVQEPIKEKIEKKEVPVQEEEFQGFVTEREEPTIKSEVVIGAESIATAISETEKSDTTVNVTPQKINKYKVPPLTLLNESKKTERKDESNEQLKEKAALLESTLKSFNVEAKIINVISGPSVTRYEIQPAPGVKVQSITRLSDDLALNMRAKSIRIEAPIPGKAAVGIEIENESREMVTFREIVGSAEFRNHKSKLAFAVGRDIGGKPIVADLAKMPHLLIAGATGSGKSVCINTIIASILYKARPEEVKLVLIDPKMVELGNYNGIPHLLVPVVTEPSKASAALNWAVAEMTDRYKKFASKGVRDLGSYNAAMRDLGEKEEILPQIVVVIDELADLMMVASNQVEDAICRLAQLARAAGMHLIIATQRPSVDVITGLIKANVPSRIAFMVSSQIDSRTIIDMAGAEKLVGNGDMLFKPQDLNKPKRIQGPFVSDEEVNRLIDYVKAQSEAPEYNNEIIEHIEKGNSYGGDNEEDELLMDSIEAVIAANQASVSMLQRRFRIGYNRAARIIDMMEARQIIGPAEGSKPRQVIMTEVEFNEMKEKDKK